MSHYFPVFLWFIFHRRYCEILNLGRGKKLGQMWMINRLSMITWQPLIRCDGLQPPALPSYSSVLTLTDFEYLEVSRAERDGIKPEPPHCWRLHFLKRLRRLPCLDTGKKKCRIISSKRKEAYQLQVKKEAEVKCSYLTNMWGLPECAELLLSV